MSCNQPVKSKKQKIIYCYCNNRIIFTFVTIHILNCGFICNQEPNKISLTHRKTDGKENRSYHITGKGKR